MNIHDGRRSICAVLIASAALQCLPLTASAQPGPASHNDDRDRREQPNRRDQGPAPREAAAEDHRDQHGNDYSFSQNDRAQLQKHYQKSLGKVDRSRRPRFEAGREIPKAYRGSITQAPVSLRRRLPPPPTGYTLGYYQGYAVVYDPRTQIVLSILDLLSQ
jgi:Ni/Co efflux regulator RcnB